MKKNIYMAPVLILQQQAPALTRCISFSGDIPDPPGQGPVQPAVGDPAWAEGVGLEDPQRSLPTLTIL